VGLSKYNVGRFSHAFTIPSHVSSVSTSVGSIGPSTVGIFRPSHLLDVEHVVIRQNKWNALLLLGAALIFGWLAVVLLCAVAKLLIENNLLALLALADGPAQLLSLFECEPEWRAIVRAPKQHDIYAPVGLAGTEVAGKDTA
jgi:hypothetical protein